MGVCVDVQLFGIEQDYLEAYSVLFFTLGVLF